MRTFKPIDHYDIPPPEVQKDYVIPNRAIQKWIDAEFQARWGRLFALADENESREICEAHVRNLDTYLERVLGDEVTVQIVPIDEPDGWRVVYQLDKHADFYPEVFDVEYTEVSGILVDTDGDGQ